MALRVEHLQDEAAFLERAGAFLARREAEHNLLFGICSAIRATPELFADERPRFAAVTDATGRVVAATLRTPPHNQVLSMVDDRAAVDAVAAALAGALDAEPLPGVLGPTDVARRFAGSWASSHPVTALVVRAERIFQLERVVAPARPASGSWRLVADTDQDLVARWIVAFELEALPEGPTIADPAAAAERWIAGRGRTGYVWEDGGEVVCFVGAGGETPNGVRIGPVYTPPERRGRGYASSLTAAASQDQLDRGHRFTCLFTDLANPTSNRIYRAIGYLPVCDVDQWRFDPVQ